MKRLTSEPHEFQSWEYVRIGYVKYIEKLKPDADLYDYQIRIYEQKNKEGFPAFIDLKNGYELTIAPRVLNE